MSLRDRRKRFNHSECKEFLPINIPRYVTTGACTLNVIQLYRMFGEKNVIIMYRRFLGDVR